MTRVRCDNCPWKGPEEKAVPLSEVGHLWERLDAGSEVPAGGCPKCGAFVYVEKLAAERVNKDIPNGKRVRWAEQAIRAHFAAREGPGAEVADVFVKELQSDPETLLVDLLADLRHWAKVRGVEFDNATRIAENHFKVEA